MTTNTRPGDFPSLMAAAMPAPTDNPCPSDPVAALTHGIRGVGWPSRSDDILRRSIRLASGIIPASASDAHKIGAAWPLEKMTSSLPQSSGSAGLNLISPKKRQATISAIERQVVGCPEPAVVVIRREWMRSLVAIFSRASMAVHAVLVSLNSMDVRFREDPLYFFSGLSTIWKPARRVLKRLAEVGDQVVGRLDADRETDQPVRDPEPASSSGSMPRCDVVAGRVISVSTPPRLGAMIGMRDALHEALRPPRRRPSARSSSSRRSRRRAERRARCPRWLSRPG